MRISDWSSDVCSSDLHQRGARGEPGGARRDVEASWHHRVGMSPEASPSPGSGGTDERRFNEKLDDIQAAHPLPYNLVVGLIVGLIALAFGFHWLVVPLYALHYRSEEHTSELQSLMRISYSVF